MSPFLILLFLGCFELTRYINTIRRLTYVANSISQMLSQNTASIVTDNDLHFVVDSTMITFPGVLADSHAKGIWWWQDISVAMSSVAFTPTAQGCTSQCTYVANVAWSTGSRQCVVPLIPAPNTASPSPLTLPVDAFAPGSLIVVDVVYNYAPVVATGLFGTMTIRRSAYIQPRYVSLIKYQGGGMATSCPGY